MFGVFSGIELYWLVGLVGVFGVEDIVWFVLFVDWEIVVEYYCVVDVIVVLSYNESFGLVVLEF